MTRFKLDENMPARAAMVLLHAGHDVSTALGEGLGGASDVTLARACAREQRVLITLDLGFADIRTYGSPDSHGIVVLRLPHQDIKTICDVLQRAARELAGSPFSGRILILEPHRTRSWRPTD